MGLDPRHDDAAVLRSLLEAGVSLSALSDRQEVPDKVLREARRLAGAEAGTLYTVEEGSLRFAAAQNDRPDVTAVSEALLGKRLPISLGSPAGFVASTGQAIPLSGRIVGMADVLDALLCRRCYKAPLPIPTVLEIIAQEDGRHFDPGVVAAFRRVQEAVLEPYRRLEAARPAGK